MTDTTPTEETRTGLREAIKKRGITFAEVADAIGVSRPTLSQWFDGKFRSDRIASAVPAFIKGFEVGSRRLV